MRGGVQVTEHPEGRYNHEAMLDSALDLAN